MEDTRKYWVALNLVLAEHLKAAKKIVDHFPTIKDAFTASSREFAALGVEKEKAQALTSSKILDKACREIEKLERRKYSILTLESENYPEYLREVFDPPFVLYCAGNIEALKGPAVSIVGARKPSAYGRAVAEKLARDLASRGVVIVSGLARGVDSIAHWGALEGGKTVAVLGSGLENIYPRENHALFHKVIEQGAVVSEFPLKSAPLGFHFPIRNRIISGLSLAVVVVEATKRSGSLISARLALEQNREVMAVPGNITSNLSQGTNWLIKTGAKLVESWEDVAEELASPLKEQLLSQKKEEKEKPPSMSPQERKVFELISSDSLTQIDDLVEGTEFSVSEILSILLKLELKGLVFQRPGKYFQRRL
ncbi:MAG: DNA-protecting protein DprA [Candidatus Aminicenantes bacterium]|nr:MAG: DNA-protecting protein DprA [Candidatus Aminicenantes bacterium]